MKKDINNEFDIFCNRFMDNIHKTDIFYFNDENKRAEICVIEREKLIADFHDKLYKLGGK